MKRRMNRTHRTRSCEEVDAFAEVRLWKEAIMQEPTLVGDGS